MGSPYKALADDTRRDILKLLAEKEHIAGEIGSNFKISKPAISNHLRILLGAEVVYAWKDKQLRIYSLSKEIMKYIDTLLK